MAVTAPADWLRARPWAGDAALAVLVALPVGASTLSLLRSADLSSARFATVVVVAAVLHLSVALRRVTPISAFAVATGAAAVLAALPALVVRSGASVDGYPPVLVPTTAVYALALYAVAAYGRRPAPPIALGVGVIGAFFALIRLRGAGTDGAAAVIHGPWQTSFALAGLVVAVVAAWSLGAFRRLHAGYAEAEREQRARAAVRDERTRLAGEMHDIVAHSLAVIVRQAEAGRIAGNSDPAVAQGVLDIVATAGRDALRDMRSLLGVLRADVAQDNTPTPRLADLDDLVAGVGGTGGHITLTSSGDPLPLTGAGELAAYRVVQEGLTNVLKHSGDATTVGVRLTWSEHALDVHVVDDGRGRAQRPFAEGGHGITGLRERVGAVGGTVDAAPVGEGFVLHARIPVPR